MTEPIGYFGRIFMRNGMILNVLFNCKEQALWANVRFERIFRKLRRVYRRQK